MKKKFNITCECHLQRNGLDIHFQSKTRQKLIQIWVSESTPSDSYFQVADINSVKNYFKFNLNMIKRIIKPFISEGKLTIEIFEESGKEGMSLQPMSDLSLKSSFKIENTSFLLLYGSTMETLLILCKNLHENILAAKGNLKAHTPATLEDKKIQNNIKQQSNVLPQNLNRKKIDRNIHKLMPTNKENNENSSSNLIGKRNIPNSTKNINNQNLFEKLPEIIYNKIFNFFEKATRMNLKVVSKDFYSVIWKSIKGLNFSKKSEIPPLIFSKCMRSATQNLEKIILGKLKNIGITLLSDISDAFQNVKELDMSELVKINDKTMKTILIKCKRLENLKLCYMSVITNESIDCLNTYAKGLKKLSICAQEREMTVNQLNTYISDTSLGNALIRNIKLEKISLFKVGDIFFEKMNEQLSVFERLETLKLDWFIGKDQESLKVLSNLKNLKNFKLLKLLKKNQNNMYQVMRVDIKIFKQIFENCKLIEKLTLGEFFDNSFSGIISENTRNLKKISIRKNELFDDVGLAQILGTKSLLEKIDISECTRINGSGLESIISLGLKIIKVSLDDYNIKCLMNLLQLNGMNETKVINMISKFKK